MGGIPQKIARRGEIPQGIWITSSDNYESWGGGATSYQTADLAALINSVDFISLHTYPFHDSHYNPTFWGVPDTEENLPELDQIEAAMLRAKNYAVSQYQGVADYVESLGMSKPHSHRRDRMGEQGCFILWSHGFKSSG
jgi:hypothetical protein